MLVVPVLDLLDGAVVRGIAGKRETYRPIESPLAPDAQPLSIARGLHTGFGLTTFYVADLDAIAGRAPHDDACDELQRAGFTLWLDAGVRDARDAEALLTRRASASMLNASPANVGRVHLVAGLETLAGPQALADVLGVAGAERTIFSLDLKAGRVLTAESADWSDSPFGVAAQAISLGVRRMIVLDLARVGVASGVGTEPLCSAIADAFPHVELIGGGGVRSRADLESLATAGCRAALVASALHFGPLTRAEVTKLSDVGRPGF